MNFNLHYIHCFFTNCVRVKEPWWLPDMLAVLNRNKLLKLFQASYYNNGTAHFKKCTQLFEYEHLLLLRDIWWSKF